MNLSSIPPPPRIPSDRTRKVIFAYTGSQMAKVMIGGAFSLVGLILGPILCWGLPGELAIAATGAPATGRVTATRLDETTEVNGRNPTLVSFHYDIAGQGYDGESEVLDGEVISRAQVGEEVAIEVASVDPKWAKVRGGWYSLLALIGSFVFIFALIGVPLLVGAVRSNRREIRAFTFGEPTRAKVTFRGQDTSVRVNKQHPWKVGWTFEVGGRSYQGELTSMSREDLADLLDAETIVVTYLPEDPRTNTAYVV
jgi:hypothetical protein